MSDRLMSLYGTNEPLAEEIALKAGPLTAIYIDGALRSISLQGVEVLRGIAFLVRDRNWATATPTIEDLAIDQSGDRFRVSFNAKLQTPSDGQKMTWQGLIEGSANGGVRFSAEALAEEDLETCRTGFVVLHPLERVAGCPADIEHTDGRVDHTAFPDLIDPIQSFFDITAMTHEPIPGVKATCRMEGGAWEIEDQRNWLDASYKTYFRPLALPWPYKIAAGEPIKQTISLTFSPEPKALPAQVCSSETIICVGDRTGLSMPEIGLASEPSDVDASIAAARTVALSGFHSLSFRLASDHPDLPGVLRKQAELAFLMEAEAALDIVVADRNDPAVELNLVATAAASAGLEPEAVMVTPEADLHSYPPSVDRPASTPLYQLYDLAQQAFPDAAVGGGMASYFTELNRRRPLTGDLDFIQHATAANVHAGDDRSIMETLETLPYVFRSVRAIVGDLRYHLGPANIGMAFNPYGASTIPNPDNLKQAMVTQDPRWKALFGAAYALGYLARAGQSGIARVTMGCPAGPFGLVEGGVITPAGQVLSGIAKLSGAAVLQSASSDPQSVLALAAESSGQRHLWIANLTAEERTLRIAGCRPSDISILDAHDLDQLTARTFDSEGTLAVDAFAIARLIW